jgi:SpoVK/Ycf46/Vps4 family AAA+-type ATPase
MQPGTGKTSIALFVHQMLVELGVRTDVKQYVQIDNGQRLARDGPDKFMKEHVKKSLGGTLFIDEAYQLVGTGSFGTGHAVLDELLTVAENARHEISIILSGYKKEMEDMINGGNVGLASRFPRRLLFEDFDQPMLLKLLYRFVKKQKLSIADRDAEQGAIALSHRIARGCGKPGFANARTMRTQWGLVMQRMSARMEAEARRDPLRKRAPEEDTQLHLSDFLGQPPSPETDPALLKLDTLIGLQSAKAALHKIATQLAQNYREECEGGVPKPFSLNCIFAGNAGTGKTSVAEMFADFLVRCGLASGITIITPAKFMAGTSAETRTALRDILNAAALSGRVLFIDEAHTMFEMDEAAGGGGVPPLKEASRAAFESIVSAIPGDGSSAFILILAGYTDLLRDMLAHPRVDQGFQRRVPHWVDFDDFSNEELRFLLKQKAQSTQFQMKLSFSTADLVVRDKLAKLRARRGWGNAGSVHNEVLDAAARQQVRLARRSSAPSADEKAELIACDFEVDAERALQGPEGAVQRAMEGLMNAEALTEQLQLIADAATEQVKLEQESPAAAGSSKEPKDSYLFLGAPGTGKTTVARRLAELLCSLGVLPSDHTHEVQAPLLIGSYLGQTKDKVEAAFKAAKGGLLFIDEAYDLFPKDVYRAEAMVTIVSLMTHESYVGNMAIVLAGYKDEMDALLNSPSVNPGTRRRFARTLHFAAWGADVSLKYIVEQLGVKRKHVLPEAQGALAELVSTMIERLGQKWGSAGDCITICDQVNGAADARWSQFQRAAAVRRAAQKLPASQEELASEAAAEAAFFYCEGGAEVEATDASPPPNLRLVTAADVRHVAQSLLPRVPQVLPATMGASADGVAADTAMPTAHAPPKPVAVLVVSEPDPDADATADEEADEIAANKAAIINPMERVLNAALDEAALNLDAAASLLADGESGRFAAALLGKLGGAPSSAEARSALQARCAEALAIVRAQLAARAAEEKRLADLKAAEEEAARARDAARQAAIAAQMAAVRREQLAQQRLQQMGVCVQGFQWIKEGSGYRCAGGSHYISCSALRLA